MKEFSDKRADKAFVELGLLIGKFRQSNFDYTNEEVVYALLQTVACLGDGPTYWDFLHEALDECINQEVTEDGY